MTRGGSQPGVKSHRRGRRRRVVRRKLPVAPWIVISTVLVLVASLLVAGYTLLLGIGCTGKPIHAVVAAAPSVKGTLSTLARQWEDEEPNVDGRCIGVDVIEKPSAEVASKLGGSWDANDDGKRPHIWIPESTAWLQMAKLTDAGEAMIPDKTPFVATSPTVIAMPDQMADTLGWAQGKKPKDTKPSWKNLVKLAKDKSWKDFGKDWGDIKLGMSNPKSSTPGLHALLSLVDANQNGTVDPDEVNNVSDLPESVSKSPDEVDDLLEGMQEADKKDKPLSYVSAFPALERDVYRYNTQMGTGTKLTSVYPSDGSIDADHPMAVLKNVKWTNSTYQDIGKKFGDFLTSDAGQQTFQDQGYRDGTDRTGGDALGDTEGLVPQIDEPQREPVQATTVSNTLTTWQALNQKTNVLVVVDTSESMKETETYQGKKQSKLSIIKGELKKTLKLFGSDSNVGLWQYASDLGYDGSDYTEQLPIGSLDTDSAESAIDSMSASGESALYDTAPAAYQNLLENYDDSKNAVNLVVLISDGGNEDSAGGLSSKQMKAQMTDLKGEDRSKSASFVTIGYGEDADSDALRTVASSGQGAYYPAKYVDEINVRLLNALFYTA